MGTFSEIQNRMPPGSVVVPPEAWSSAWDDRPIEEVCIGLRFVPDADLEDARIEAFKRAERLFPKFRESEAEHDLMAASYGEAVMRWVIARGTCDPNNVHAPWEGWSDAPEDIAVEVALNDLGAQLIFDKWEEMRIASDIGIRAATDEDLKLLPELLTRLPILSEASRPREQRLRRLLRFVLEELEQVAVPVTETPPEAAQGPAIAAAEHAAGNVNPG